MDFDLNLGLETCHKSYEKPMDFWVKNQKNREKTVPKTMFFSIAFFYRFWEGLGRFWDAFGRGFRASWSFLDGFLASFFKGLCPRGPERA